MAFPTRPIAHRCNLGLAHSEITVPPNPSIEGTCNIWPRQLSPAPHVKRSAKSRGGVVLVLCPAAWTMTGAFICRGSNHCNRVVPGRDIGSRTQCREETRHALQYFDLADPQSSRRFR